MSKAEIECSGTDSIVCPYCGHGREHEDENHSGQKTCNECDKNFECEADFSVSYSTWKVPCLNGEPHDFRTPSGWISEPGESIPFNCRACGKCEWRKP